MENVSFAGGGILNDTFSSEGDVVKTMREFIASAVVTQKNLLSREKAIEESLKKTEQTVDAGLKDIENALTQVRQTLEDTSVESWRESVETLRSAGKERTQGLRDVYTEAKKSIKQTCDRTQQTSSQILKGLGKTLDSLHPGEFQHLSDDSTEQVKKVSDAAIQQISNSMKWFHWKNLFVVFMLSLVVSLSISLYLDDEWPWQAHDVVVKQRAAGEALINTWAQLSPADQELIAKNVQIG